MRHKNPSFLISVRNALEGIRYAITSQRNMKIHCIAAFTVGIAGWRFHISGRDWTLLVTAIVMVIVAELFNTAIEAAVDLATQTWQEKAKVAKDVSAGAVLVTTGFALGVGYLIFWGRLVTLFTDFFVR